MKIFKFGGASVKDANAIKNVAGILKKYSGQEIIIVVSAMGKVTNSLERLTDALFFKKEDPSKILENIRQYHTAILNELFPDNKTPIHEELHNTFVELDWAIEGETGQEYNHVYDQIVSMGEIISSRILSAYLNEVGIKNKWWDARDVIQTDNTYREGNVNWELSEKLIQEKIIPAIKKGSEKIIVLQGFIGGTSENFTTTLGREGSDYTAAIMAYTTDAESVTIWKDVPGVLNADPKWFDGTQLIEQLSYHDAIELSYYGATVIHPKTIKPLQNKKIPLYVKSFLAPEEKGTVIIDKQTPLPIPCFIFKINQILISISPKDFSFIAEDNLSDIFKMFSRHGVKINTMQMSAISFSICADNDERKIPDLIKELQSTYRVLYNENMELVTIRYYNQSTIDRVNMGKRVLLEVKSRYTVQMVMKDA